MECGPPSALRQSSDKVPIGNCAIFGCRFIQDALANKAWTDGRVSAKFHLTKKSWELQNQKWLCGNELFKGHPHSHMLSLVQPRAIHTRGRFSIRAGSGTGRT
jgi:hypothetical protein